MFHNLSAFSFFCIDGHTGKLVQQGKARLVPHVMTQEELSFTDIQMLRDVGEMDTP